MKQLVKNNNGTYTAKMEGYSITTAAYELEKVFNECFEISILDLILKLDDANNN